MSNTRTALKSPTHHDARRGGFTLVEMMVALAVFLLLMAIIFVPLTLGFRTFNAGNNRAQVQAAANQTVTQMERELRTAVYVYPNSAVPGVSSEAPYNHNSRGTTTYALPYLQQDVASGSACGANISDVEPVSNTARLDFIPPRRDAGGNIYTPLQPADYIVTYYARRLDLTKDYDPVDNPIVLYRAQIPYRNADGTDAFISGKRNLNTGENRYPNDSSDYATGGACDASNRTNTDNGSRWLLQANTGEPLYLQDLTNDATGTYGSHTLLTPRGMEVVAPHAADAAPNYMPTTTFSCADTNGDGNIDRVTLRLFLASEDGEVRNGVPTTQSQGLPQAIDLPNAR